MLYSIADDKYLRAEVNSALTQIADVPVSANVKTVAQVTLASYIKNPVRRFDFEKSEIVGRLRDTQNRLQFDSPKNLGTAANLTAFLLWARRRYPAEKYCIILQGHASGADFTVPSLALNARSAAAEVHPTYRLIFGNPRGANSLNNSQLQKALGERQFDLLGIDSCLMCMAEICYELQDSARYVVATEGLAPARGWPIGKILTKLQTVPKMDAPTLGTCILNIYGREYKTFGGKVKLTTSLCSLGNSSQLAASVRVLTSELVAGLALRSIKTAIIRARVQCGFYALKSYVDLYDYCDKLARQPEIIRLGKVGNACRGVQSAVKGSLVMRCALTRSRKDSHGLSIFFPNWVIGSQRKNILKSELAKRGDIEDYVPRTMKDALHKIKTAYTDHEFVDASGWQSFLISYLAARERKIRGIIYLTPSLLVSNKFVLVPLPVSETGSGVRDNGLRVCVSAIARG